jgi:tRNA(Ile)-lysidine synthase
VGVLVKRFETEKFAEENRIGIQEAARNLRYEWFNEIVCQWPIGDHFVQTVIHDPSSAMHLLTAHHADDNIETVLMNFCRGTGLHGLEGIPVRSDHIRRPMLGFWKDEIIQFAKENKLDFAEDSSNQTSKYTRNLFRNEIIPLIAKVYPQVKSNLQDNIDRFKEIRKLYSVSVAGVKKKLCKIKDEEIHIPVKQLISYQNRALIFEIIFEYGFTEKQVDEVVKLAESESGKFIQSPASRYRIIKFRNWFIISEGKSSIASTVIIDKDTKQIEFENGKLKIESIFRTADFRLSTSGLIAYLDAKEISFPLILRNWKQSDYFYPLGMKKKKKLARFLIDRKISKTEKEKIRVLEMNKKIIWVVGLRIDDRFKITDKTKNILKISLEAS